MAYWNTASFHPTYSLTPSLCLLCSQVFQNRITILPNKPTSYCFCHEDQPPHSRLPSFSLKKKKKKKDGTWAPPEVEARNLNHWTVKEVPLATLNMQPLFQTF